MLIATASIMPVSYAGTLPPPSMKAICDGEPAPTFDPCERTLWPNGVIYYELDSSVTGPVYERIRHAMDSWEQKTGSRIRFVQDDTKSPRVIIGNHGGCSGGIPGMEIGNKSADLSANCMHIPHELGHVIGLSHEHQRYDRDRFVSMGFDPGANCDLWQNNGVRCAFASSGSDFGPYRTDSCMQYNSEVDYPFYDKSTGQPVPTNDEVTDQDGANAREMYSYEYHWKKFFPTSRDVGGDQPLDVHIKAGVNIAGSPAIASQGGLQVLDAFVRGSDRKIYHRFHVPEGWSDYYDLGGPYDTDPAGAAFGTGKVVVAAARDGQAYTRLFIDNAWQSWANQGHPKATQTCSAPGLASAGNSGFLFVRGCDDTIYVKTTSDAGKAWSGWTPLERAPKGVKWVGKPVAAAWSPTHVDLFINSTSKRIWHKWYESTWKPGWENLLCCAYGDSSPAVAARTPDRLDIVYRGADNGLWWYYYDAGQWRGSLPLGGLLTSDPAAVSGYSNHIDVLSILRDGGLWHRWYQ